MQDRRPRGDLVERVLRVLARRAAAGEERLQRLRGELDRRGRRRSGPASRASSSRSFGLNMQSLTVRCGRLTSAISGSARRMRSSISLARAWASASALAGSSAERQERDQPVVGLRGSAARAAARPSPPDDARSRPRASRSTSAPSGASASAARPAARGASAPTRPPGTACRSPARPAVATACASSSVRSPGSLRWSETSSAVADERRRRCASRARAGRPAPRRARARAARPRPRGLDVDDDVAPRQRALDRLLDRVGRRMPLADAGVRRDADDDVREVAPGRLAHPQPPQLDRRIQRRDRQRAPPPPPRPAPGP